MPILLDKAERQPSVAETHLRADYAELLCLLHPDNELSKDDVLSFYREAEDVNENLEIEDDLGVASDKYRGMDTASRNDLWWGKANDWFEHLRFRQQALGDVYPFQLSADNYVLQLQNDLTNLQKLYLYLLLASNLRCVETASGHTLTNSFEYLCALVTQRYLSSNASVHIFGTSTYNEGGLFNLPTAIGKIERLATYINERVTIAEEDIEHFKGSGDAGLDIVAWNGFQDDQKGLFILFAQCACTMDWKRKQQSSSYERWKNLLSFSVRPTNAICFPFFYRRTNGLWYNSTEFRDCIPIDRLRILQLVSASPASTSATYDLSKVPLDLVDQAINMESASLFY